MKAVIYELIIARALIHTVMSNDAAAVGAAASMNHEAQSHLSFRPVEAQAAAQTAEETERGTGQYSDMRLPVEGGGIHHRCPHLPRSDARQLILLRTKQIGNARNNQPRAPAPKTGKKTSHK